MRIKIWKQWLIVCGLGLSCAFSSCSDDKNNDVIPDTPETPADTVTVNSSTTLKVNKFVYDLMSDVYVWKDAIDWTSIDYTSESDSYAFLNKLKYKDDRWSMLSDNISREQSSVEGVSTTFGYELIFGNFSNAESLFAIVLYVYPNTPAEKAGLKRGDILVTINGGSITESNYADLYYASSLLLGRGIRGIDEGDGISLDSTMLYMTAVSMYSDPIIKDTVIVKGANKIGYLCYSDFTMESESALVDVFSDFKQQGVTDVVLDLRYNGGGYAHTSRVLSSILGPNAAVKSKAKLLSQVWNKDYMLEWQKAGYDEEINDYFIDTLSVNMDLSRLYVLATGNTASASESTITGLSPYLDIVQIGDTTHGKYCGGIMESVEDYYSGTRYSKVMADVNDWGAYVMVYKFANIRGDEFPYGLAPNYYEEEDYFNLYPFGDERDPLLGKALSLITGEAQVKARSLRTVPPYIMKPMDHHRALDGKLITTMPQLRKK